MALTEEPLCAVILPDRPLADCVAGLALYEAQMVAARLSRRLPAGTEARVCSIQWQPAKHACREAEDLPKDQEVYEEYALFVRRVRRKGEDILFYGTKGAAEDAAESLQLPPGFVEVRRVYWWPSG